MSERRDFLKAAALQFGVLATPPGLSPSEPGAESIDGSSQGTQASKSSGFSPPPQAPIEELHFPQYQLSGQPDPETNLLGTDRPQNWGDTKKALRTSLSGVAAAQDPIHEWLKVFDESFADRVSAMLVQAGARVTCTRCPSGLRYEPQLYDAALRSASFLLDRCLRYRTELGGYEVTGIGAGLSYLTFLKLKPIQRNFLAISNSADLSSIDESTEEFVAKRYKQQHGMDRLVEGHVLDAKIAEATGAAASAELAKRKTNVLTHLLEKQFNLQADAQLAQFTRMLTPGSSSNVAERYLRSLVLVAEDVSDAYCMLYSAAKGVQQVMGLSTLTVAMNQPISTDLPLFASASDVSKWVNAVVPTPNIGQRKPDALDALVLWSRAVMRDLDERSQSESEFTLSIPLTQPWGHQSKLHLTQSDIQKAFGPNPTGSVSFTLTPDSLGLASSGKYIRVTGVGVSVESSQDSASPVQYADNFPPSMMLAPPPQGQPAIPAPGVTAAQVKFVQSFELQKTARLTAVITTPPQMKLDKTTYSRPSFVLPSIRIQGGSGGDSDPVLAYDPPARGLSPIGQWIINFDPNVVAYYQSSTSVTDSWVNGLILHLRVRLTNG